MSETATLPDDKATWNGNTLTYDSWNEFRTGDPHQQEQFTIGLYDQPTFCYWCAADGRCMALEARSKASCIAAVESALRAAGARSVYVIWQPKDRSATAWARWSKKWTARTLAE